MTIIEEANRLCSLVIVLTWVPLPIWALPETTQADFRLIPAREATKKECNLLSLS